MLLCQLVARFTKKVNVEMAFHLCDLKIVALDLVPDVQTFWRIFLSFPRSALLLVNGI